MDSKSGNTHGSWEEAPPRRSSSVANLSFEVCRRSLTEHFLRFLPSTGAGRRDGRLNCFVHTHYYDSRDLNFLASTFLTNVDISPRELARAITAGIYTCFAKDVS